MAAWFPYTQGVTSSVTCDGHTPPKRSSPTAAAVRLGAAQGYRTSANPAQQQLLEAISDVQGRGKSGLSPQQQAAFEAALEELEAEGGLQAPISTGLLEGRWRLLFTTRPGTASPIQRTFTGVEAFSVFQDIKLEGKGLPMVTNVVDFGGSIGVLRVEAEASTDRRPLPGFTPRKGAGLAVFGKSATYPPAAKDMRIDFQFSAGYFKFNALPITIPYPVPFKLLGDETKGWIDITYLSPDGTFRITRGNKGTVFVLQRELSTKERLLEAAAAGDDDAVLRCIEQLTSSREGARSPAKSPLAEGRWRQRWSQQAEDANKLQKKYANAVGNFQVIGSKAGPGQLQNVVELAPGLRLRAPADIEAAGPSRTMVSIRSVAFELGPLRIPIPFKQTAPAGYVDWLYLDEGLRITRGNKGSLFVHTREE